MTFAQTLFKIIRIAVITFFIVIIIIGIFEFYTLFSKPKTEVNLSQSSVVLDMQSLNRLETASFTIEKIIEAGTQGNVFQNILYGDKILLIAHAEIIAGIDFSKLKTEDVEIKNGVLSILLPAPEILVSTLDNTKTRVYDRRSGLLTNGDKDLESEARAKAEQSIRQSACEGGILVVASENATKQVTTIFQTAGFESVTVTTRTGVCQ